jgi:hypothetical protein
VLHNDTNRGLVFTRNRTFEACRAPFAAIADADDVFHPRRLEQQWQYLAQHPDVGVLSSAVELMDRAGQKTGEYHFYTEDRHIRFFLLLGPCLWNTTSVYRGELLKDEPYRPRYCHGTEDYDLWSRLLKKTRFAALAEPLATVRVHGSSITSGSSATQQDIFEIGSGLMSEYLQQPVARSRHEALSRLLLNAGMEPQAARLALDLGPALWRHALRVEAPDTVQLLRQKLFEAFWPQAQYQVYAAPQLSRAMARFALSLRPSLSARSDFARYCCRCLTPQSLRLWYKRTFKGSPPGPAAPPVRANPPDRHTPPLA